jgi:DNA repair exonuclease SbcCD ATPase subunit
MTASSATAEEARANREGGNKPPAGDRYSAFYVVYVGLFALLFGYLATVRIAETMLASEFQERVERAIQVDDFDQPVIQQIQSRIKVAVHDSAWVRWGGLRVTTLVLAQDGLTWLYVDGRAERPPRQTLPSPDLLADWIELLPAQAEVEASLPHNALISNSILIVYASILLQVVYLSHRRATQLEAERLETALAERTAAAEKAERIQTELAATRRRLSEIVPKERQSSDEIDALQREREELQRKLAGLAAREETLRNSADRAMELAQEVRALEDLLEEATGDLDSRDQAIDELESTLKKATKSSNRAQSSKAKTAENLARRFRTLYKTIEIDTRAIDDIAGLGDESLRLKAEESIKRLADDADNVAVRRKVGGLPEHVQAFELGFAGKGRIYYARGKTRRFRVLCVGAKNTQDADLDYLARLPREEFG